MPTAVDIGNRALQMMGSRTTIASLAEQSNEAIQINLVYQTAIDWAFAATNWNFARNTAQLLQIAAIVPPLTSGGGWTQNGDPQPPWLYAYYVPPDFIRAIYLTNLQSTTGNYWDGEPQRYVLANDLKIPPYPRESLMTNVPQAILIYTARVPVENGWPAMFERFAVASLANAIAFQLSGDHALMAQLREQMMMFFQIAEQQNLAEELLYTDVTPEWIQAIGIKYPMRRYGPMGPVVERPRQNDRQR